MGRATNYGRVEVGSIVYQHYKDKNNSNNYKDTYREIKFVFVFCCCSYAQIHTLASTKAAIAISFGLHGTHNGAKQRSIVENKLA